MLLRAIQNKRAVSVVIGYVLLIAISIVMSVIVYQWLKTYVPREATKCSDGTSVFIDKIYYDCTNSMLNITLKNNGKFSVNGYFIHVSNRSDQEIPTIDISKNITKGGVVSGNAISFSDSVENALFPEEPGNVKISSFKVAGYGRLYKVEIIPTRLQEVNNKKRLVSCGEAKVNEELSCYAVCKQDCTGRVCGLDPTCKELCPPGCTGADVCNSLGQCIPPAQCADTCATYGYQCETWTICGQSIICGSYGGGCQSGYECNALGRCVSLCGNGAIDSGETCDDGDTSSGDGCSASCLIETGFTCSGQPSTCTVISSCPSYCVSLNYNTGYCTSSAGTCGAGGGIYQSGGDKWCTGGSQADTCCCTS